MLAAERDRLDALNVFPVPDGDTGTNLLLTLEGGLRHLGRAVADGHTVSASEGLAVLARGTLNSARGNSGVILSQLVRGLSAQDGDGATPNPTRAMAAAFDTAARTARSGIARPVEGTMLSVAEAAAGAASRAADAASDPDDVLPVVRAALDAAREALHRTPDQLPALAQAGVVDAGGAGLVIVLEALVSVLTPGPDAVGDRGSWRRDAEHDAAATPDPTAEATGPAPEDDERHVEVMYLLESEADDAVDALRARLDGIGDSVMIAGEAPHWHVHVHVPHDETASAIDAGALAGRVSRVRVSDLDLADRPGEDADTTAPHDHRHGAPPPARADTLGLVACAPSAALAEVFEHAGAVVIRSDAARRATVGELMSAAWVTGAADVLVLANDATTRDALASAVGDPDLWTGRQHDPRIHVLPSTSAVAGLAAAAVFDRDAALEDTRERMSSTIEATRHGSVLRADRDATTPVGACRSGQALALVDWDVVDIADTSEQALRLVLGRLLPAAGSHTAPAPEILTVLVGADGTSGEAAHAHAAIERALAGAGPASAAAPEIIVLDAGQPRYAYLVGVET